MKFTTFLGITIVAVGIGYYIKNYNTEDNYIDSSSGGIYDSIPYDNTNYNTNKNTTNSNEIIPNFTKKSILNNSVDVIFNNGVVVGGYDYATKQSINNIQATLLKNNANNPILQIARDTFNSSSGSSKKSSKITSSINVSSKNTTPQIVKDYQKEDKVSTILTKKQISSYVNLTGGVK